MCFGYTLPSPMMRLFGLNHCWQCFSMSSFFTIFGWFSWFCSVFKRVLMVFHGFWLVGWLFFLSLASSKMQFFAKPSGPSNVIEMFFKVHWPSYAIISDGRQPSVQLCDVSFKSNWQKLLFLAPYIKSPQKETLKRRSQISWLLEIMRIYCYFSPLCFGREVMGHQE